MFTSSELSPVITFRLACVAGHVLFTRSPGPKPCLFPHKHVFKTGRLHVDVEQRCQQSDKVHRGGFDVSAFGRVLLNVSAEDSGASLPDVDTCCCCVRLACSPLDFSLGHTAAEFTQYVRVAYHRARAPSTPLR